MRHNLISRLSGVEMTPDSLIWGFQSCYVGLKHALSAYLGWETRLFGADFKETKNGIIGTSGFLKMRFGDEDPR